MRSHSVGHRLHRGLGVERDDARLDQVGDVGSDHHDPEQLAVAALVDRLRPADGLVLHHSPRVGDPREDADLDIVAVLLAGFALRQADACDLGIRVDRTRDASVVDDRFMAHRVLGGDLALPERRVRELPVAGAVADGVDVLDRRPAMLVGGDTGALVELDADLLEAEVLYQRTAADGDEHQVGLDRLAVAEVDRERRARVLHFRALLLEVEGDAALLELLRQLGRGSVVLHRDQLREQLDDRHLGAEALEDRRELAADDPAAEDDQPPGDPLLREQAFRVDAAWRIDALDRRNEREAARGDDCLLERDVLAALDRDRVRVLEAALALDPVDAVRLEERGDTAGHLLDDARLPLVCSREVEVRLADLDAELGEGLLGLLDRECGLHPGLRRDTTDAQAGAAELGLLLDAGGLRAELRGADRGGVAARAPAEDGNVTFHESLAPWSLCPLDVTDSGASSRSGRSARPSGSPAFRRRAWPGCPRRR